MSTKTITRKVSKKSYREIRGPEQQYMLFDGLHPDAWDRAQDDARWLRAQAEVAADPEQVADPERASPARAAEGACSAYERATGRRLNSLDRTLAAAMFARLAEL